MLLGARVGSPPLVATRGAQTRERCKVEHRLMRFAFLHHKVAWAAPNFNVSWCKVEHRFLRCALLHHKVARVIFDPLQFSTFPGVKLNIDFCDVQFYKANGALLKRNRSIFRPGHTIKLKISFCDVQFYKANGALLKRSRSRSTGVFAQNGLSKSFW